MLKFSYLKTHSAVFKAVVILRGEKIRCGVECGEDYLQMLAIIVIASRRPCLLCYLLRTNGSFWLESYMANWNPHISGFNDLSRVRQLVNLTRMEVWFLDQSFLCSTLPLPPPVVNREEDVSTAPGHNGLSHCKLRPKTIRTWRVPDWCHQSQPPSLSVLTQNKSKGFAP